MKKRIVLLLTLLLPIGALAQTPKKPDARPQVQPQIDKGPSLTDTNAWIAEKLVHFAGYSFTKDRTNAQNEPVMDEVSERITEVNLQDGNWQFTELRAFNSTASRKDGSIFYVFLTSKILVNFKAQNLSPSVSVRAVNGCYGAVKDGEKITGDTQCFVVTLGSEGRSRAVSLEQHSTNTHRRDEEPEQSEPEVVSQSSASTQEIFFNNEDTANRVAKAISHAVQLAHREHPEPF